MTILRFKEWVIGSSICEWVYESYEEPPVWDEDKQEYIFEKQPKRIKSQKEARQIIKDNNLKCVHTDEEGQKVYA